LWYFKITLICLIEMKVKESTLEPKANTVQHAVTTSGIYLCFGKYSELIFCFLTDRTIGRAFGTLCRLMSVGNQGQKVEFLGRRHISTSGFVTTATEAAVFALFLPVQPSNRYQMVEVDFLAADHVHIVGLCGQNQNRK